MDRTIIWSSGGDVLKSYFNYLSDRELMSVLMDKYSIDADMLGSTNIRELADEIAEEKSGMFDDRVDKIIADIDNQTENGIVVLVDEDGYGKAIYSKYIRNPIEEPVEKISLAIVNGELHVILTDQNHESDYTVYRIDAGDLIDMGKKLFPENDPFFDPDVTEDDVALFGDDAKYFARANRALHDLQTFNDYADLKVVKDVLKPVKIYDNFNVNLDDHLYEKILSMLPSKRHKIVEQLGAIANNTINELRAKGFVTYSLKENLINITTKGLEYVNVNKNLNEAKNKEEELKNFAMEYESIKNDYDSYGLDAFYHTTMDGFKRRHPLFFKHVIEAFLKKYLDVTEAELNGKPDADGFTLMDLWSSRELFDDTDVKTFFDAAEHINKDKRFSQVWGAIGKKYYIPKI